MRLYIDSNVFISIIREEVSTGRSLFAEAKSFFEKVAIQEDTVIISWLCIKEVQKITKISENDLLDLIKSKNLKVEFAEKTKFIQTSTYEEMGIHFPDSLNVAIAIQEKCDCIITFNAKDFEPITGKIMVLEPNQL